MADQYNYKGIQFEPLQETVAASEKLVTDRLDNIRNNAAEKVDVGAMFDLQWMMNKFTQICEGTSAVLQGCHSTIQALIRGVAK